MKESDASSILSSSPCAK